MVPEYLNDEFCNILSAWQTLETSLHGDVIVDFNLIEWSGDNRKYNQREEVLTALEGILSDPNARQDRKFFQRVYGLRAYLHDVLNNQQTPFNDYLRDTMGIEVVYIPDEEIAELRRDLTENLEALGINFANARKELAQESTVIPVDDIPAWFDSVYEPSIAKAEKLFGFVPDVPQPIVRVYEEETSTIARIFGEGSQFYCEFNRKNVKEDSEEKLAATYNHEILGHAVNAIAWIESIRKGHIAPHHGLTCMQGYEAFQMEGIAETAALYFGDDNDPLYDVTMQLGYYARQVTNNMIWILHNSPNGEHEAQKYLREHTPFDEDRTIRNKVKANIDRGSLYRAYVPVYSPAMRLFYHAMQHLDETGQRQFLIANYTTPMDPTDIYNLALQLGAPPLEHFKTVRPDVVQSVESSLRSQLDRTPHIG